jgi:hypothetical protein
MITVQLCRQVAGILVLGAWILCILVPVVRSQPHNQSLTIAAVAVVAILTGTMYCRGMIRRLLLAAIPVAVAVAVAITWQEGHLRRQVTKDPLAIVGAGDALISQISDEMMTESRLNTIENVSQGVEISPADARVPQVFRSLGAERLWIDQTGLFVSFGKRGEVQVARLTNPEDCEPPMWYRKGKGGRQLRISGRLWLFVD